MKMEIKILLLFLSLALVSCSYNPFIRDNHTTGNPAATAIGVGAGVGTVAVLGGPKWLMGVAGVGGGMLGYYLTSMRHDAGGIIDAGGQAYVVGQFLGIYIPSDALFEVNTAEFLPQAPNILDSAVAVLERYPNNNILISGNTSGFSRPRWEKKLSLARAKKVADYLWHAGINPFKNPGIDVRKLNYVGYGDYFPIATNLTNEGIRENSRIQITSYPSDADLHLDKRHLTFHNIGTMEDNVSKGAPQKPCYKDECDD